MDERESHEHLKSILERAAAFSGDARAEFLDRECGADASLRARVEQLLGAYDAAGSFLHSAARTSESASPSPASAGSGRRIGPYSLLESIGEGGFGVVYLAEQHEPIQRKVALKLLRVGTAAGQVLARFEAERQALALMDHPNIAVVHDAGVTESGDPYFVMEYVAGLPITSYADDQRLGLEDRLRLFIQLCEAVQHAHQKGVIHRDLKPSNVLVASTGDRSFVKVIDFGVAKALGARLTEETLHTQQGVMIGTPEYMSPEQAAASPLGVDTRSDVYSLGVILYELLVGAVPFDRKDDGSVLGLLERIRDKEAPKPTTRLLSKRETAVQVAAARRTDPAALARRLRGDLEWITLKCLEKDPARRYGSASALAEDIKRYLGNHPITARPPSTAYHLRKLVARHRAISALGAIFALSLLVFAVTISVLFTRQRVERLKSDRIASFLQEMLASVDPNNARGKDVLVRDVLDDAARKVRTELAREPEVQAALQMTLARTFTGLGLYQDAETEVRAALATARRIHGERSLETAAALHQFGALLGERGQFDSSAAVLTEAVALRRKLAGANSAEVGSSLNELASVLTASGKLEDAERTHREALTVLEASVGKDDPTYLIAANALAMLLRDRGRYAEAESLHREVLAGRRRVLGPDHPEVAESMSNLASVLRKTGGYAEAESLYHGALAIHEKNLGEVHPAIAVVQNNLALLLKTEKRYAEAESLYLASLAMRRATLGEAHPSVANTINNLAALYEAQGKLSDAEALYRQSYELKRKALGNEHPAIALTLYNLSGVLVDEGRMPEAEQAAREALAMRRKLLGDRHPDTVNSTQRVSTILLDQRKSKAAENLLRDVLEYVGPEQEPTDTRVRYTDCLLGESLLQQGALANARELLVPNAESLYRGKHGSLPARQRALRSSVELLNRQGDRAEAARFQGMLDSLLAK